MANSKVDIKVNIKSDINDINDMKEIEMLIVFLHNKALPNFSAIKGDPIAMTRSPIA